MGHNNITVQVGPAIRPSGRSAASYPFGDGLDTACATMKLLDMSSPRKSYDSEPRGSHLGHLPPAVVAKLTELCSMHSRQRLARDLHRMEELIYMLGEAQGPLCKEDFSALYFLRQLQDILAMDTAPEAAHAMN